MAAKKKKPAPGSFVTTTVEVEGRVETKIVAIPAFEPAPWTDRAELTVVGRRAKRVDAAEKVTGRARYTVDARPAGMLHAAILRAPIALRPAHAHRSRAAPSRCRACVPRSHAPTFPPSIHRAGLSSRPTSITPDSQWPPCAPTRRATPSARSRRSSTRYERAAHAVTAEDALAGHDLPERSRRSPSAATPPPRSSAPTS